MVLTLVNLRAHRPACLLTLGSTDNSKDKTESRFSFFLPKQLFKTKPNKKLNLTKRLRKW